MVRKEPNDWEAFYRQGEALVDLGKTDDASRAFRACWSCGSPTTRRARSSSAARDPKLQNQGVRQLSISRKATMPLEDRLGAALEIRSATRLAPGYYAANTQGTAWVRRITARRGWPRWAGWSAWPSGRVPTRARR